MPPRASARSCSTAGALYHTKESDVATFEQDLALYKSAVITAFQNVADLLRAIQYDAETLKAAGRIRESDLPTASRSSIEQFKTGSISYATVINAQQSYLNARVTRIKAQAQRYSDTQPVPVARRRLVESPGRISGLPPPRQPAAIAPAPTVALRKRLQ